MSSYACGGVDKLMEFFVILIISEIDPSLIEQASCIFLEYVLQLILVAKMKSKAKHLFDNFDCQPLIKTICLPVYQNNWF